jgi:galactokinase
VNVIGEHTDYNGGPVLPIALPHLAGVAASPRTDGRLVLASLQVQGQPIEVDLTDIKPGKHSGWTAYPAGVSWALSQHGYQVSGGATLLLDSEVPVGAGLSSSAAIECATGLALTGVHGITVDPLQLALIAQHAENDFVGIPCGVMDQMASMLCTTGHALYLDAATLHVEQVPFDLASVGLVLLVIDTGAPHQLADGEYANRRKTCEQAASELNVSVLAEIKLAQLADVLMRLDDALVGRRVRHVVTEIARVKEVVALLHSGRVREIGPLLTASHISLRDDYQVSVPQLDIAVEAALEAGAYGARMTGGGFGGSIIALVDAGQTGQVTEAIKEAFETHNFAAPTPIESTPSSGARRLY